MLIRGNEIAVSHKRYCFSEEFPGITVFNEGNVKQINNTFGEMVRNVFDFKKQIINK